MTIEELHNNLQEAYSVKNLNKISLTLISLYKEQQFSVLKRIAELLEDFKTIEINDEGKGFSKFMMLYHPDRSSYHILEINRLFAQNNYEGLLEFTHIFKLERLEEIATRLDSYEDIDYSPVYEWDVDTEGFRIIENKSKAKRFTTHERGYSFYEAIKIREYGHTKIDFPAYYLEDFDEFELSSSGINDLEGVQFCIHAKSIDLSDNKISDLTQLLGLFNLEELNLSDNMIEFIDVIGSLPNIKNLYLSNNHFKDISPLFELENLEYVDLSGNQVSQNQIDELKELGVVVDL